ncbi:ylmG homolog protein 2, chloroplastic isoform X2 [Malania oleifera]|uniref:ylmG homolog protein 2, chloroplastic isoform X2 n=1 Tax=Malania oleifera TaxID=397392 RepID=UPI0025ADB7DF|nr:ylmG homolog protein 2, chloroplastic isoform X2 [Malania oleifera]
MAYGGASSSSPSSSSSSSPSSPSSSPVHTVKGSAAEKPIVPSGVLLSSTAFFRPFRFKPNLQATVAAPLGSHMDLVQEIYSSVLSTAHTCFRLLHSVASQNPILNTVFSLPSRSRNFFLIPRRNFGNLNSLSNHNFAAVLPGDSVAGVVVTNGILNFLSLYNTLLVVRLVLTWFPNSPPAIVSPLSTLCDPYLNIFRGLIPPLGGTLDLSPILAFLVLNAFTSTAAALPAELPATRLSQESLSHARPSHVSTSQEKWMRRLCRNRSNSSGTPGGEDKVEQEH